MDGANHYWIDQGNYFTGIIGVSSRANGNEIGIVSFNEFSDNYIGVYSYDGNPKFSFSENCFDSRIVDVSIHGSISPEIGGTQGPSANNCFTHKGVWSPNAVRDIGGNPDVFIYYEPDLNGFDCRDAFLAPVSVNRLNIVDGSPAVCESIGGESNRPSDGNDSITESLILMGDFEGAINAISTLNHEENFINTVSIRLIEGNLTEVNKLMDSQLESNENISDFKNVVSIGIDLLFNHDLSEIERNILLNEIEQMSFKSNSVSGFAQALYYRATGQFVENLDMSLIQQHHTLNERNFEGKIKINNTKVAIYPNPTKGVVTIKSRNSIKKLNVYNLLGTMILELENLNSCAILDLNKYEDGIYYIRLMDENGKEHIEKVIKN
jgi:hypothetical protein